jgi:hypothetical protein
MRIKEPLSGGGRTVWKISKGSAGRGSSDKSRLFRLLWGGSWCSLLRRLQVWAGSLEYSYVEDEAAECCITTGVRVALSREAVRLDSANSLLNRRRSWLAAWASASSPPLSDWDGWGNTRLELYDGKVGGDWDGYWVKVHRRARVGFRPRLDRRLSKREVVVLRARCRRAGVQW